MDRIGSMIGGYRITRKLGAGAMSEVWLGENAAIGKRVAIKCFKDGCLGESGRARFFDEARIQFGLTHPNIIQVENLIDSPLAIIMEYASGGTLTERLAAGPATLTEMVEWMRQICAGVGVAHGQGVVHRDIKPDNILLTGGGVVKVTDFGLARWLGSDRHTCRGRTVGTPEYMAPEQAQGLGEPTSRTDVYALGVLLYELLAGAPPFRRTSEYATLHAHISEVPPDLPVEHGPPELNSVIMRALRKDPSERFSDATAFWTSLLAAVATEQNVREHYPVGLSRTLPSAPRLGTRRLPSVTESKASGPQGTRLLPVLSSTVSLPIEPQRRTKALFSQPPSEVRLKTSAPKLDSRNSERIKALPNSNTSHNATAVSGRWWLRWTIVVAVVACSFTAYLLLRAAKPTRNAETKKSYNLKDSEDPPTILDRPTSVDSTTAVAPMTEVDTTTGPAEAFDLTTARKTPVDASKSVDQAETVNPTKSPREKTFGRSKPRRRKTAGRSKPKRGKAPIRRRVRDQHQRLPKKTPTSSAGGSIYKKL